MELWESLADKRDKLIEIQAWLSIMLKTYPLTTQNKAMVYDAALELDDAQVKLTSVIDNMYTE